MSVFANKTPDEKREIVKQVNQSLWDCGLARVVQVIWYRHMIQDLKNPGKRVNDESQLKLTATHIPSEYEEHVQKFNQKVKPIIIKGMNTTLATSAVCPGSKFTPIPQLTTLDDPETMVDLNHVEGEVWLIDFWATWCPPCQAPMAHNEKMLQEHGEEWGDKVKIICISQDNNAQIVKKHIENKKWLKPIHYHRGKSDYGKVYGIQGIPHVLLIDKAGKICFRGHPASRQNLVNDINKLLNDEQIIGEGCAPMEISKTKIPEGFKESSENDLNKILAEMDDFKETGYKLNQALRMLGKDMHSAQCNMILTSIWNPISSKWITRFVNQRAVVGPKDNLQIYKDEMNKQLKGGTFEVSSRFQVYEKSWFRVLFEIVMSALTLYSVLSQIFYAAFGPTEHPTVQKFDYYIDHLFTMELMMLMKEKSFKIPNWLAVFPKPLQLAIPDWWITKHHKLLRMNRIPTSIQTILNAQKLEQALLRCSGGQTNVCIQMVMYVFKNIRLLIMELVGVYLLSCVLFIAIPEQMNAQETKDVFSDFIYSPDYDLIRISVVCLLFMVNFAITIIEFIGDEEPEKKEKEE